MSKICVVTAYEPGVDRCGVGAYAQQLISALSLSGFDFFVDNFRPKRLAEWWGFFLNFFRFDVVHYQYPMEIWGASVLPGILPVIAKIFFSRAKIVITLHEWKHMHFLRRLSVIPAALASDRLVFVSAQEVEAFDGSLAGKIRKITGLRQSVIPIGVNLNIPEVCVEEFSLCRKGALGSQFDLLLGYFGFIYEAKQPYKMIDMVRYFVDQGVRVKLIICGDFPLGHDDEKILFLDHVKSSGLSSNIDMKGYVDDERYLRLVLGACDVNIQLYDDGVSTRRGSFWYALDSGLKVLTTKPRLANEFVIGGNFSVMTDPSVYFVDVDDSVDVIGAKLLRSLPKWSSPQKREMAPTWAGIAKSHCELYSTLVAKRES